MTVTTLEGKKRKEYKKIRRRKTILR